MYNFVRAAAFAVAGMGALIAPTFADPSLAFGIEPAPVEASFIDHASANVEAAGLEAEASVDPARMLAHDVDFANEIAEHAVAAVTADPEPAAKMGPAIGSLATLVANHAAAFVADREMECLAGAIYFESKGEPLAGQLAVAEVIINRTKSGKYPTSLCGVVKQPGQFSFVRGGRMPAIDRQSANWRKAVAIAHIARNDLADSPVPSAISFHATYVSPGWRMKRLATVGRHVFYR
jgi:spore germination cell wall hydrolase CwlJ-like protein